jgi:hypothetical protein
MQDLTQERLAELLHECERIPKGDPPTTDAEGVRMRVISLAQKMSHDLGYLLADPIRRKTLPAAQEQIALAVKKIRSTTPVSRARAYALATLRSIHELLGSFFGYLEEYAISSRELHHMVLIELARAILPAQEEYEEGMTDTELAAALGKPEQDIRRALTELTRAELVDELPDTAPNAAEGSVRYFISSEGIQSVE